MAGMFLSWSYLIDFEWIDNKWRYRTKDMMEGSFTMNDKHGNSHPLQRLEVTEGRETLGVHISMDGNDTDEYKHLRMCAGNLGTTCVLQIAHLTTLSTRTHAV